MSDRQFNTPKQAFPSIAAVLFDGSYWNFIRKEVGVSDIDLITLSDELCHPASRLRTYYFDGKDNYRQSFHDGLKVLPRFEVILGDVVERKAKCPHCQEVIIAKEQKRVDVQLAVQMVHLATSQQVSLIVLVAGDRDFIPSVEIAKHSGVIVRLVHGPKMTTSTDLRQLADETFELTKDFLQQFLRKSKKQAIANKIEKRPKTVKKSPPKISQKQKVEIQDFLHQAIQNTSPEVDGRILASELGIAMSRIHNNWKTRFGVKSLVHLLEVSKTEFLTPQRKGKVLSLYLNSDTLPQKTLKKSAPSQDQAVAFLVQTLKKLEKKTDEKRVRLSVLGIHLTKIDPTWKEKYGVKKLSNLTKLAKNKIYTEGEGINMYIGLKN